jgi:hypothetical protein
MGNGTKRSISLFLCLAFVTCINPAFPAFSQSATTVDPVAAIEWPQWTKDMRRFDVITFGAFPFAWLFSSLGYGVARWGMHGWDSGYTPAIAGGGALPNKDNINVMLISAGVSLAIAAADLTVILIKRNRRAKQEERRGRAMAEIKVRPLNAPADGAGTEDADTSPRPGAASDGTAAASDVAAPAASP